jgi:hypothetical protein
MGLLKRRKQEEPVKTGPCEHGTLTPRWDSVDDIGKHDRATAWVCDACGATLTPEEADRLRQTEAERLKRIVQDGAA